MKHALLLLPFCGCAAPMSTFHTGRTAPLGTVELNGGVGLHLDSSFLGGAVDSARVLAEQSNGVSLDAEDQQVLVEAALAGALAPPIPVWEASLRVGVARGVELGGGLNTSGWALHAKGQLLDSARGSPVDMALALQVQRQSFGLGLPDVVGSLLEIDDLSRTDLVVPLSIGRDLGEYGWVYAGPKLFASKVQADVVERVSTAAGAETSLTGWMGGGGAFAGIGLGWRYVYVIAELNALGYRYRPTFLGQEVPLSGVDVYPALGLRIQAYDPARRHPEQVPVR